MSDQDNCLIIDDARDGRRHGLFRRLAKFVSDGLNACGYVYCPGDMMATNPRWCQPMRVWREYFAGWVDAARSDGADAGLGHVRPAAHRRGDLRCSASSRPRRWTMAAKNSIFVAHMIPNSLKHAPPLGLLRGFATIRSGEHKNHIDLKQNGVVPVVDLGRVYALIGRLAPANTRARLEAAEEAGVISASGARDLIEAYDLIARTRLEHQARQVRAGEKPDNFLAPSELSDFERSHLRDAFVVVRTMQSAVGHARGARS